MISDEGSVDNSISLSDGKYDDIKGDIKINPQQPKSPFFSEENTEHENLTLPTRNHQNM